jgi:hypothetical protein
MKKRIKIERYKISKCCPDFENGCLGEMKWEPPNESYPTKFRHICDECKKEAFYFDCYPKYEDEETWERTYRDEEDE